jgi:hypothetical protein
LAPRATSSWRRRWVNTVQFRAEAYNAWNHASLDTPNTTPTSTAFGTITNTISEPRGFQFALKFTF